MRIQVRKPSAEKPILSKHGAEDPKSANALIHPAALKPNKGDLILSVSEINELLNCGQKWGWKYRKRIVSRGIQKPLFLGSLVHYALNYLYQGQDPNIVRKVLENHFAALIRKGGHIEPDDREACDVELATCLGMIEGYRKVYPPKNDFQVVASEYPFILPVGPAQASDKTSFFPKGPSKTLWFVGVIDLIVFFKDALWVVEHKTSGRIDKNYLDRLELDYQITGMLWALHRLIEHGIIRYKDGTKPKVKGVVYNVIRKPGIRQKQKQTRDQYIDELESLYVDRAAEHYHRQEFFRGDRSVKDFENMLCRTAGIRRFYDTFNVEELPRNTMACTAKGTCEYLPLCTRGHDRITSMLYREREGSQLPNTNQPLILE